MAAGLTIRHGAQLAVDITLRSVLTCCGAPRPNAAAVGGAILTQARRDKEARYSELVAAERCRLVVVTLETGGRWSAEALSFIEEMAQARARNAPFRLRRSAFLAWRKRWTECCRSLAPGRSPLPWLQVRTTRCRGSMERATPDLADLFGSV